MNRHSILSGAIVATLLTGCTLDLDALRLSRRDGAMPDTDGGPIVDTDAGPDTDGGPIVDTDGGPIVGPDGGPGPDGGADPDGGVDVDGGACVGISQCPTLGVMCDGDEVVTCAVDAAGCNVESRTSCEDTGQVCVDGACVDPCAGLAICTRASYCDGDEVVTCAPNADGCLVEVGAREVCEHACREGMPSAECSADPCPIAIGGTLGCGSTASGDILTDGTASISTYGTCSNARNGREVIHRLEVDVARTVTIQATAPASHRLFVTAESGPTCAVTTCLSASLTSSGGGTFAFFAHPGRVYYVALDELNGSAGGAYSIEVSCAAGTCGDGAIATTETCDDSNTVDGDGCSSSCESEPGYECSGLPSACTYLCGNGSTDAIANETCDDSNTADGDGCSASCQREPGWFCTGVPSACLFRCGNNTVDASANETCDDGNAAVGDGCSGGCRVEPGWICAPSTPSVCEEHCGDGALQSALEGCDDGNDVDGDGCSASCVLEAGYTCSGGGTCRLACGDGVVEAVRAEGCDDDGVAPDDGCSSACFVEAGYVCAGQPSFCALPNVCGNGLVETMIGEQCDDRDTDDGDGCSAGCFLEAGYTCEGQPSTCETSPRCGNSFLEPALGEQCDDGTAGDGDGCSGICAIEGGYQCVGDPSYCAIPGTCGNGLVENDLGEACDDGGTVSGDGCTADCLAIEGGYSCVGAPSFCAIPGSCGNGLIDGFPIMEECDDLNALDGDGCSAGCTLETGYRCRNQPSACTPTCGDGLVDPSDECDDGGRVPGDGCSGLCEIETGSYCTGQPSSCFDVTCGDASVEPGEGCDDGGMVTGDGCSGRCAIELPAPGATVTVTGSMDMSDPTFQRAEETCGPSTRLGAYHYDAIVLENTAATAQTYRITATWTGDGYLHAYAWPFVPELETLRCLAGDDDVASGMLTQSEIASLVVGPGERIVVVTSQYNAASAPIGAYSIDFVGL